jgi:hypothetical protein
VEWCSVVWCGVVCTQKHHLHTLQSLSSIPSSTEFFTCSLLAYLLTCLLTYSLTYLLTYPGNIGAKVILTTKGIDDLCLKYFVEAGAIAVRRVKPEDLKRIAKATGGSVSECVCVCVHCTPFIYLFVHVHSDSPPYPHTQ